MDQHGQVFGEVPATSPVAPYHEMQPANFHPGMQPSNRYPMSSDAQFRVASWQGHYDSGVQSLQHSQTHSMMSLPQGSHMSVMSVPEALQLSDQEHQRFENIRQSLNSTGGERGSAARAIPELLNAIRDDSDAVVSNALAILVNIARMDAEVRNNVVVIQSTDIVIALANVLREKSEHPSIVRSALMALFQISSRSEGLELVFQANEILQGSLLRLVIQNTRIPSPQHNVHKHAIPLLHSLLSHRTLSAANIQLARHERALEAMMQRLTEGTTDKLSSIIVEVINILCNKCEEQIAYFFTNNGPNQLVQILMNGNYENLLLRTISLVNKLISSKTSEHLVDIGIPTAASLTLRHPSSKIVMNSLLCLRSLSHVRNIPPEVASNVMQVLGSHDLKTTQYTVEILTNLCIRNSMHKMELTRNPRLIHFLLEVLSNYVIHEQMTIDQGKRIEALHEAVSWLLSILSNPDYENCGPVQMEIVRGSGLILNQLENMRPKILKNTLQLVDRLANNNACLSILRDTRTEHNSFVNQITVILKVACANLYQNPKLEEVPMVDLMTSSMKILRDMGRDRQLFLEVVQKLSTSENMRLEGFFGLLPIFALHQNVDENERCRKFAVALIEIIVKHQEMAQYFLSNPSAYNLLKKQLKSDNQDIERTARSACNIIEGIFPGQNAQIQRPAHGRVSSPMENTGSADVLPSHLSNLNIGDDPFANVFMPSSSNHSSPPFSPVQNQRYPPMRPDQQQWERYNETMPPFYDNIPQNDMYPPQYPPPSYPNYHQYPPQQSSQHYSPHNYPPRYQ